MDKNLHLTDATEIKTLADGIEDARDFILHSVVQAEVKDDNTRIGTSMHTVHSEQYLQCFTQTIDILMKLRPRGSARRITRWVAVANVRSDGSIIIYSPILYYAYSYKLTRSTRTRIYYR